MQHLTIDQIAAAVRECRELWRGADEAPAVRSVAHRLAESLQRSYSRFDYESFLKACGYETNGEEVG